MKFLLMLMIAGMWGIISAHIFPAPYSYIFALIGGGIIGYIVPKIFD